MPPARSDNKKAEALPTCSKVTFLRKGAFSFTKFNILPKSLMPAAASVLIGPAEMPFTRMPRLPSDSAR